MWKTIVRRILILIPMLLILSLCLFFMAQFMPGDPYTGQIDPNVSPQRLEELRQKFGYYDPWYVKYTRWLGNILKGDFGQSTFYKIPVTQLIGQRAGNTFWLSLVTVIFAYLIGIPLGILAGRYHGRPVDKTVVIYTYFALAMPTVVFALINLFVFGYKLGWFPVRGSVNIDIVSNGSTLQYLISRAHHIFLPAITGALLSTVSTINYLRSEIIDYKVSDFVTTAKSKGVPQKVIYNKHIFRNALLPVASSMGYAISGLLTGSIFIERIFSYPGMGQLFIEAIGQRDFAVVNALVIFFGALIVLGTLLSDIIITVVDPRIRIK